MPTPLTAAAMPIVAFKLQRSTSRPTKGSAKAETTMKVVTASDRVDRLTSRSSDMGFNVKPKANREPPLKNSMKKPVANMTQL